MKQIILGTAGHIDHGKTSLIKAITGVDTDRLKEEKLRGITIELGFADLTLPSGQHIGIVDVPGHEKFVKNMVSGATGIDIVAMVIAADEGVMPQTREHMDICGLLNVKTGLIALTKIDMIDEEWQELVTEDIKQFTKGTFLENAPIVPISSSKGLGLDEFIKTIDRLSEKIPSRSYTGLFRLPVDRVFTMKGFGTVITGTLISGHIKVGDSIMIYPSGITSKVRGIQSHNQSISEAKAGMRTAINFQGLEKEVIQRGDVISTPGSLKPSYMLDIFFNFLKSNEKPIKNKIEIRFHSGTSEIQGNLILLDREELNPGESAVTQIRLDSPVTLVKDDKFIIRSYSPARTIGGGFILNPIPKKHKRFKQEITDGLKNIINYSPNEIVSYHAEESIYRGISFSTLKIVTNIPEKSLEHTIQDLLSKRIIINVDKENLIYIHSSNFEKLKKELIDYTNNYHKLNPLKEGMSKEELKSKLHRGVETKLFNLLINQLIKEGKIAQAENIISLTNHKIALKIDQVDIKNKILDAYAKSGLAPPYFKELSKSINIEPSEAKEVLLFLIEKGELTKVKDDLYFKTEAITELKNKLVDFLNANGEITTSEFKNLTSASRKYLIPLMEYFDMTNITIRVGDIRKLRKI
ncbi:MAG: selenocysteine-specific translation elongation factor [Desulfobacterales bacterium]|nr:selenocysteine-specific translation elongation factor [Desulfobacterales bacterium]MBF0396073.1 selenocysteine-specific translation elongation factor [Desulfobacterales bacterium]